MMQCIVDFYYGKKRIKRISAARNISTNIIQNFQSGVPSFIWVTTPAKSRLISLDYIKKYEPLTAQLICDHMEEIMAQTKQNGFHFVDEAAPPNLLREVALEILRRKLVVVWWTNIRFEKHFTADLSRLLKASGCIAVAGGLEVASDRLLFMMKKGVTVAQVAPL